MNPRLLEAAADEIARLDTLVSIAPRAYQRALEADLVARLATPSTVQAIASNRVALVAAAVDSLHAATLDPVLAHWRTFLHEEARLIATGLPLTTDRVLDMAAATARSARVAHEGSESDAHLEAVVSAEDSATLDAALRPGGHPRSLLLRAIDCARALRAGPVADLVPALLLTSGGLSATVHLLPFAEVPDEARRKALEASASRADDEAGLLREEAPSPDSRDLFAELLLADAAEAARARRVGLRRALRDAANDDALLAPLGRAGITARQALAVLRERLATSVPDLSGQLRCSRPAAGDALERLVGLGLAFEITGRGRDRVFVDGLAWRALP